MKGQSEKIILDKSESIWRWAILVLGCLMMVGSYYCFDIPAALKTQIDDYMGDPSDYEISFGLFYTLYSAPNVILPFFGGYLVDRIGVRMCLLLFSSLITLGQVIFSLGLSIKSWPVMFLGRLIFGFGGESFTVANSALLAQWFKGKELAFAFGVNLSISKLGSVVNNLVSPILTDDVNILFALWFGAILCGFCVCCVMITMPLDLAMENKVRANLLLEEEFEDKKVKSLAIAELQRDPSSPTTDRKFIKSPLIENDEGRNSITSVGAESIAPEASLKDVFQLKYIFWILVVSCMVVYGCVLPFNNISSSLLLERDYFKPVPSGCAIQNPMFCENDQTNPFTAQCSTSSWYQPPLPFNTTLSTGESYNPLSTSDIDCTKSEWKNNCATDVYCSRLNKGVSQASVIMSIPYIISACLSPPLGYAIDMYGFRACIAAVAPAILIIVHLMLGLTDVDPVGPLVGQGLAYTGFVSVLWPAVPLVVRESETGLAFGIVTSAQNLATAIIPLIAASIYNDAGSRYCPSVEMLFVGLAAVGFCVGVYMNVYDWNHGHHLNGRLWRVGIAYVLLQVGSIDRMEYEKMCQPLEGEEPEEVGTKKALLTDEPVEDKEGIKSTEVGQAKDIEEEGYDSERMRARSRSRSRSRSMSQQHNRSHGGSFTSYEEALRGGAFRGATVRTESFSGRHDRSYSRERGLSRERGHSRDA